MHFVKQVTISENAHLEHILVIEWHGLLHVKELPTVGRRLSRHTWSLSAPHSCPPLAGAPFTAAIFHHAGGEEGMGLSRWRRGRQTTQKMVSSWHPYPWTEKRAT